ncbi:MAG: PH domain-containing protein, partial [Photobacterium halotolerans]
MGLLDKLLGNAGEMAISEATEELQIILGPNEKIELAYKLIRDMLI